MFLNDLYTIKEVLRDTNGIDLSVIIQLNPLHRIFAGHFPGKPVLPGVCVVQILKELLTECLGRELILREAGTIKYLSFINPVTNTYLRFDMNLREKGSPDFSCDVSLNYDSVVFSRFKGEFKVLNM